MRIKFLMSSLIITLFICPRASGREKESCHRFAQPNCFCHFSGETLCSLDLSIQRLNDGPQTKAPLLENNPGPHIKAQPVPVTLSTRLHDTLASSNIQFKCLQVARQMGTHFLSLICCPQRPLFFVARTCCEGRRDIESLVLQSRFCHNRVVKCGADIIISARRINRPPVKGFGHQW